ncbi:MAG: 5'-methylthioadenosine/S-adenosylhomocysteine nucleosidase [Bacillota bacterium]|nr:5'-methylthioadenosine/S-adenosylhomocysteine nucleosidase [Bacillota bacterium]
MKLGMLVAVEIGAVIKSGFKLIREEKIGKFAVYIFEIHGQTTFVIHSGAGQTFAAAATEILISVYKVDLIINFGIVGSLREDVSLGNTCVVEKIVDYMFDTSEIDGGEPGRHQRYPGIYLPADESLIQKALAIVPELRRVTCASGNKFVGTADEKRWLHQTFNCDIVEMEAAAIQLICDMHDIPCLFIKGISDTLHGGAEEFTRMFEAASDDCFRIVSEIMRTM